MFRHKLLTAFATGLFLFCSEAGMRARSVPEARYARAARGVNLSHWFSQFLAGGFDARAADRFVTDEDLRLIRSVGFTYVRLPVDPEILWAREDPAPLRRNELAALDHAVTRILDHDLAVMLCVHAKDEFKAKLKTDEAAVADFAKFWRSLAAHFSATDPDRLFLELFNEPAFAEPARWQAVQQTLLGAARAGAPRHTLVATGDKWSDVADLEALKPYDDPNVLYNIHCYTPGNFTHQGAPWGWDGWKLMRNLPYPSSPEAVAAILPEITDEETRRHVAWYGAERWDAAKLRAIADRAAAWGKAHGVRVICNEFGVRRADAPPAGRAAWLRDVREAMETNAIGWAMWDYAGQFSFVDEDKEGRRTPDPATTEALGLGAPVGQD